eukprot:760685-Hanusia_phi.AAC.5
MASLPEEWYNPSAIGKVKPLPVRKIVDDLLRQGQNDDQVMEYMSANHHAFVEMQGITREQIDAVRSRQNHEMKGVPRENRISYRDALIKCLGTLAVPWLTKINSVGNNRLDLNKLGISQVPEEIFDGSKSRFVFSLSLANNLLHNLSKNIRELQELTSINLSGNRLKELPPELGDLKKLKILNLERNKLKLIPNEFGNLRSLETLILAYNELECLPFTLARIKSLAVLTVTNNPFMQSPPSHILDSGLRAILAFLDILDEGNETGRLLLAGFKLKGVPPEVLDPRVFDSLTRYQSTLIELDLSNNSIAGIPDEVSLCHVSNRTASHFSDLTSLDLSNNLLNSVPRFIVFLSKLRSLNLEKNFSLNVLPVELGNLTNLTNLLVSTANNQSKDQKQFHSPPPEILNLSLDVSVYDKEVGIYHEGSAGITINYLRMINNAKISKCIMLSNMGLLVFPPELQLAAETIYLEAKERNKQSAKQERFSKTFLEPMGFFYETESIFLSRNMIKRMPEAIGAFQGLKSLDFSHNQLVAVPDSIGMLTNLTDLILSHNLISSIPDSVKKCNLLERFLAQSNKLAQVSKGLFECIKLKICRIDHNLISEISHEMSSAQSLTVLNASFNHLVAFPETLGKLTGLKFLHLDSNKLKELPRSIGRCTDLLELSLRDNDLSEIPPGVGKLYKLKILRIEGNERLINPPLSVAARGLIQIKLFLNRITTAEITKTLSLPYASIQTFPLPVFSLHHLTKLDLSHNQLKSIPKEISKFSEVTDLKLSFNRLRAVPEEVGLLELLRSLHLNNNQLKDLPGSMAGLANLHELCLHSNKMRHIPLCLGALENVRYLSIADNPLEDPPSEIVNGVNGSKDTFNYIKNMFDALSSNFLNFESFNLVSIPQTILMLTNLEVIFLGKNQLKSIPRALAQLKHLKILCLDRNQIESVPDELRALSEMENFDLSYNCLSKFPAVVLDMHKMKELRVNHNNIHSIPERMDQLSALTCLAVDANPIESIPINVCKLTCLRELRFNGTQIRRIPMELASLSHLRCLRMDETDMVDPPPEVCKAGLQLVMDYLSCTLDASTSKRLILNKTSLAQFPDVALQRLHGTITSLHLSRNRFTDLPEQFSKMRFLTELDLSHNHLERIPLAVCKLIRLQLLNLKGNVHIKYLPVELGYLKELSKLFLSSDFLLSPPPEIVKKDKPNFSQNAALGVVEYLQIISESRFSSSLSLSRMGLRQFPPELVTAISSFWEYSESKGVFLTGEGNLKYLQEVVLDHNNIQILPAVISQMPCLETLNASANLIQILPASIGNLISLKSLDLSKNGLVAIHEEISNLVNLEQLKLHENQISELPECISALQSLKEFSISHNNLVQLPSSLPKLTSLRNLLVASNNLSVDSGDWGLPGISYEIGYMTNLVEIDLYKNELLKVPPMDVCKGASVNILYFLRALYEARKSNAIDLKDLDLREIPDILMLMQNLHSIILTSNAIRFIKAEVKNLTTLTFLNLDNNDLVTLPDDLTKISNLISLSCNYNQLKALPFTCNKWVRMEKLHATDNKIRHLPEAICEMPNLTDLDLDRNCLLDLPEAFVLCTSLTRLKFDTSEMVKGSPARELPDGIKRCEIPAEIAIRGVETIINHFFKMHVAWTSRSLDLSGFGLRYVMNDVCNLSVLTSLDLSENRLFCLPSAMSVLTNLKTLNLDRNLYLDHFHHNLHVLTNLQRISIRAGLLDSWLHPAIEMKWPPTIVARDAKLMIKYLTVLNDCVGYDYVESGQTYHVSTNRLDYRFVPHEVSLDPVTAGEIDSDAKRSFPNFPPEIDRLGLTNLTWLQLPGGRITSEMISEQIPKIPKLKKLVLIDQEIEYIPPEVAVLTDLEVLCFTGNRIKEIPDLIFKIQTLTKLILVENHIAKVPKELGLLTNLTDLVLTYNKLKTLPKQIGELWKLDYLVLDENMITELPDSIEHLTSLNELSFNDNRITRFPLSLGALTQLEILEFAKNPPIVMPPKQVLKCEVQVVIDFLYRLWQCRETSILDLKSFALNEDTLKAVVAEISIFCTELDLSKNSLTFLPANIQELSSLKKLELSQNNLRNLNLEIEMEVSKIEEDVDDIGPINLTLQKLYKSIELDDLYNLMAKEHGVRKVVDLVEFVKDNQKVEGLPIGPLEKIRLIDAVYGLSQENTHLEDEYDQSSEAGSEDEAEDDGDEEERKKRPIDDFLEDNFAGQNFKVDFSLIKNAAHATKVAFYQAILSVKAKLIERQRRKDLRAHDKVVAKKASGFKRKLERMEAGGIPKKKGKKKSKKTFASEEERLEQESRAKANLSEALAQHEAKKGTVEDIVLEAEMGGGLVKQNIYSVAVLTELVELRCRKCMLEYLPEDIGKLTDLTILDCSKNDIRWIPPSFSDLKSLKVADLRNNILYELPENIGNCQSLSQLYLQHNKLYNLPLSLSNAPLKTLRIDHNEFEVLPDALDKIEGVEYFSFSQNKIKRFSNNFGQFAKSLIELKLAYNNFSMMSIVYTNMVNLKVLDISGNPVSCVYTFYRSVADIVQVKNVPDHISSCENLEELYINLCSLDKISIYLAECKNLKELHYDGNDLMKYPPKEVQVKGPTTMIRYFRQILDCTKHNMMLLDGFDLSEFDNLVLNYSKITWLDMSNNNLMKIPTEIRQLQQIELVNFSHNKLGCIPKILTLMYCIQDFSMDDNGIEQIEPSIALLTGLTRLSLSENRISRMHPALFKLTQLTILNINSNRLQKIPESIRNLAELVTFSCGGNLIEDIPPEISELENLRQLVMFGNRIRHVCPELGKLTALEVLSLSQNQLADVPKQMLKTLTNLRELWLAFNQLQTIPSSIGSLMQLEQLWLQDNDLESLPPQIGNLTKLSVLTLTGNRITELPESLKGLELAHYEEHHLDKSKKHVHVSGREGVEYWQDLELDRFVQESYPLS